MTDSPLLHVADLDVSLSSGPAVLSRVDIELGIGRIVGVIGESGAGKSMIGAAIADTLPSAIAVTGGSIRFDGIDLTTLPAGRRRGLLGREIGFIPQEPMTALNPSLTIGHQVRKHLARIGLKGSQTRVKRAVELFEEVGLNDPRRLLGCYPHQLSGGMLQRILIAMAFASNPKLVIADEPTTALDVTIQARVIELIDRMRELHGTSVLFITHDLHLAADLCDDVTVLYAGRIVETGTAKCVLSEPRHPYSRCLYLATPNMREPTGKLLVLPHAMPSLIERNRDRGCDFAGRCPVAAAECVEAKPPLQIAGPGHRSACLRPGLVGRIQAPDGATDRRKPSEEEPPLLKASGVGKTYHLRDWIGRTRHVEALRNVEFHVREREFVGVVGESGSGKSTLTKLIVGLEDVTAGTLNIAGIDSADRSTAARRKLQNLVQLVFQDPQSALNPRRRVGSLVTQTLEVGPNRASAAGRRDRVDTLLAKVKLSADTAHRFPDELSGGQKQRVNIARALCASPRLLIADEIVSGLDVSVQAQILELLRALRDEMAFSLLLISHDLAVVRHVCDRAIVMYQGEIVEQGPVETVFSAPRHPYTQTLIAAASGRAKPETAPDCARAAPG